MVRLAIVDKDSCKSNECSLECVKFCPVNRTGKDCIVIEESKARISEILCNGCAICVKKCPFDAITIINLPESLDKDITHRYGPNQFKLHRLPIPRKNAVIGLVGQNGAGKSTSLKILSGEIKPNLGHFDNPPDWDEIIANYRGSQLQNYFKELSMNNLKVAIKPQNIELIPKVARGIVSQLLEKVNERGFTIEGLKEEFNLGNIWNRSLNQLSGGELQRVAIAATLVKDADVYFIDEPSSYLDVKERLRVARLIRNLIEEEKMVLVVEHDLTILDYLSDYIHIYYGEAGAYGVVTHPLSVREGINIFLEGYIPSENMRFRNEPIKFQKTDLLGIMSHRLKPFISYGAMTKAYDTFKVEVQAGSLYNGNIVGIVGPNGIGKTTFVKLIAGKIEPTTIEGEIVLLQPRKVEEDEEENAEEETLNLTISYKPQYLNEIKELGITVEMYLKQFDPTAIYSSFIKTELLSPLDVEKLLNRTLDTLSGGELQKVAIAACLLKDADLYLIDEPSAFISAEDRVRMAKAIRRLVMHRKSTALVIEHDLLLQSYIADRIIYFEGEPGRWGKASHPMSVRDGMNAFLKDQGITFRTDPQTKRPRVNKLNSKLDKQQKAQGNYFLS